MTKEEWKQEIIEKLNSQGRLDTQEHCLLNAALNLAEEYFIKNHDLYSLTKEFWKNEAMKHKEEISRLKAERRREFEMIRYDECQRIIDKIYEILKDSTLNEQQYFEIKSVLDFELKKEEKR